ncbi:MAG TPA: dephospho-CoA kinase [Acidimicrobiia bacterium]|nr:dephospho-CoA kinase [Acidimicrobiia bacterium]
MSSEQHRWVLSGGLASGKSTVRVLLAEAGVTTVDADSVGHDVLAPDGPAFPQVADRWPEVITDGAVDRRALAGVVFNDMSQLRELEGITHPHIFDRINDRVKDLTGPVVVEIPVLGHGLGDGWRRVLVDARDEVRLERAVERGMGRADALARMDSQPSRAEWLSLADLVIPNNASLDELRAAVAAVVPHL